MIKVKKYILIATAVILLLLIAGSLYFVSGERQSNDKTESTPLLSVGSVPSDAIVLICFKGTDAAWSAMTDSSAMLLPLTAKETPLIDLLEVLSFFPGDVVLSLHSSAKNEVSALLSYMLPEDPGKVDSLKNKVIAKFSGASDRLFNDQKIFSTQGFFFSITQDHIVASSSSMVLESSLRHLISGNSLSDNQDFMKVLKKAEGLGNSVIINHTQIGKLISGTGSASVRKHISFANSFSGWSVLAGDLTRNQAKFKGFAYNSKDLGNFSNTFSGIEGTKSSVMEMLPYTTLFAISYVPVDFSDYLKNYRDYRDFYRRQNSKIWESDRDWFLAMRPQELATALILYKNQLHWITLVKCGISKNFNPESFLGESFREGALSRLFGNIFSKTREEDEHFLQGWLITGSRRLTQEYREGTMLKLTLKDYLSGTDAYESFTGGNSPLNFYSDLSMIPDSTAGLFRERYRSKVKERLKEKNLETLTGSFSSPADQAYTLCFATQKRAVPQTGKGDMREESVEKNYMPEIPKGPFELLNPLTGEREYLEQLPSYILRLTDKDHKGIWAIPFETPLRGYVEQVDFFGNNQLQMLFASGNTVYLLDRKGKYVSPYPKKVDSLILLGPKCFDLKGDGDFAIMVLGTDNTLRLFDRLCKPYHAWSNVRTEERIKSFPSLLRIGKNNYFVLRTDVQKHIYTSNGIEVVKLPPGEKIASDSEIEIISSGEIIVKSDRNRFFSVNVKSGKIKLRN